MYGLLALGGVSVNLYNRIGKLRLVQVEDGSGGFFVENIWNVIREVGPTPSGSLPARNSTFWECCVSGGHSYHSWDLLA